MTVLRVYAIIILKLLFLPFIFGQPQLSSSIGSLELSGEQCPGTLTLTCDARNFGISEAINWFVGDDRLAVFDFAVDPVPFTTTTNPNLLNSTVQLTSANFTDGLYNFVNFTLFADLSYFLSLQRRNITCGDITLKSLPFVIKEVSIVNETTYRGASQNVSYLAKYSGTDGGIMEFVLNWIEKRFFNCTRIIPYSVTVSHDIMSMTRNFTSEVCSSSQCLYKIYFTQNITSDVIVEFYADGNLISSTTIASTTGNNLSVDECSGELSIGCSDLNTNENCTINYQQDGLDFNKTVPPLNKFVLPMGVMQFQVIIKNESAIFQQAVNHSFNDNFSYNDIGSSVVALIGVGIAVYVLGLTEHLVALLFFFKKTQGLEVCWKRLIFTATMIYFIIAIIWIVAFSVYTVDLCGTLRSTEIAIHIMALVLSIIITSISTITLAVVLIVCPCKGKQELVEYEMQSDMMGNIPNFTFKVRRPRFICCTTCHNCNEKLTGRIKERRSCGVCGNRMCINCYKKKTMILLDSDISVSDKCMKNYLENNEKLIRLDMRIGQISSKWKNMYCNSPCAICKKISNDQFLCNLCGENLCSTDKDHFTRIKSEDINIINEQKSESSWPARATPDTQDTEGQEITDNTKIQLESTRASLKTLKEGDSVCNICYTLYKRKQQAATASPV